VQYCNAFSFFPPSLRISLAIWNHLLFHKNSGFSSYFMKSAIGIMTEIATNLQMALYHVDSLVILFLPMNKHGVPFRIFVPSSFSFINVIILIVNLLI
jgi:hypothetical protein